MNENTQAEMYLFYLDQILTGEKQLESIEDAEIKELLQLAETMLAADFSVNSKMKEQLLRKLMAQGVKQLSLPASPWNDGELDEAALDLVAAGQPAEQRSICPHCGANLTILEGKCTFCKR